MLNRIWLLTKLEACNIFGFNQIRYSKDKKEKQKARGAFTAYLIIYLVFGAYAFMFAVGLATMGAPQEIPTFFTAITMAFILITNIFKAGSMLFSLKNYEKLAPLPVKPIEIVISRFIYLYIISFITDAIFYIPAMVIAGTNIGASGLFYVNAVLSTFFMPFLPVTISILFGTLIMLLTSKMKHKNIFQTVFTLLFSIAAISLSFLGNTFGQTIGQAAEDPDFIKMILEIANQVKTYFPISNFAYEATVNGNMLYMLLFVLAAIVPFGIIALFTGWRFVPLCQKLNVTAKAKAQAITYGDGKEKNHLFKTMVRKELKRIITSPMYLTNAITGFIMLAIVSIGVTVMLNVKFAGGAEMPEELYAVLAKLIAIGFALFGFMTCASVSSISIEGKNWWIYKTLPISQKQIIDSKLAVNYILSLPFVIIAVAVLTIFLRFPSWDDYVLIIMVPLAAVIFNGVMGMKMNMKYPKLEWNTEVEVVKQSKAVTYLMLIGMAITFTMGIPTIVLGFIPGLRVFGGIYGITYSAVLIFISYFIYKKLYNFDLLSID